MELYEKKLRLGEVRPQIVYLTDTKDVLNNVGSIIDRCENVDEFLKEYSGWLYSIRSMSLETESSKETIPAPKTITKYRLKHK
jgi:hypothetical protein